MQSTDATEGRRGLFGLEFQEIACAGWSYVNMTQARVVGNLSTKKMPPRMPLIPALGRQGQRQEDF